MLPIRMNAADTRASRAIADWMALTSVPRSSTTAEIETFMIDVSTTSTNMAIASRMGSRRLVVPVSGGLVTVASFKDEPRSESPIPTVPHRQRFHLHGVDTRPAGPPSNARIEMPMGRCIVCEPPSSRSRLRARGLLIG